LFKNFRSLFHKKPENILNSPSGDFELLSLLKCGGRNNQSSENDSNLSRKEKAKTIAWLLAPVF